MDGAALAVFAVGTACNAVKAVPQFVRTAVRGRVAGLSGAAVWLAVTANVLWLCFGIAIGDRAFVALGLVTTALTAGTAARFVRVTGLAASARPAGLALTACVACALLAATGSGLVLELLGAGLGVVVGLPQLLHLWRRRATTTDVSGVAQGEHVVVVVGQAAWTTYWLLRGHPVAATGALWGGAARAVTLGLLRRQVARARLAA